jgi:hypothetical protein
MASATAKGQLRASKASVGSARVDQSRSIRRLVIQNIYIRKVEYLNGVLINREISTIPNVKDPWKELHPEG